MHPRPCASTSAGPRRPGRTRGGSRRYSEADIALLRRIQELTNDGLQPGGVKRVLGLEDRVATRGATGSCRLRSRSRSTRSTASTAGIWFPLPRPWSATSARAAEPVSARPSPPIALSAVSRPLRPAPGRARALRSTLPGPAASRPAARLGATVGDRTALALVAVGALAFPAVAGAQARHVVVVSDSIFLGAKSPFGARMQTAGWTVDFDGAVSRSTLAGADAVRSRRATITDSSSSAWVANDSGNTSTFRSRVDAVAAAADGVPGRLLADHPRGAAVPRRPTRSCAGGRRVPNLHVVDWNAASAGRDGLTSGDGLHLTPAGAGEIAALVGTAVTDGSVPVPAAAPPPPPPEPVAQSVPVDPPVVDPAIAAVGAPTAAGDDPGIGPGRG